VRMEVQSRDGIGIPSSLIRTKNSLSHALEYPHVYALGCLPNGPEKSANMNVSTTVTINNERENQMFHRLLTNWRASTTKHCSRSKYP
jgi:hypothetical protein